MSKPCGDPKKTRGRDNSRSGRAFALGLIVMAREGTDEELRAELTEAIEAEPDLREWLHETGPDEAVRKVNRIMERAGRHRGPGADQ